MASGWVPRFETSEERTQARALVESARPQGHSNQGHDFHTDMSAEEKAAVIEYLKTL